MLKMTIIEFNERFGSEEQCRLYLFSKRWENGFVCPKCGHTEYFDIKSRNLYQCKACNHQASVTAGTIMDKTRTSLVKWFMAIYLISEDKRGISALALKNKIGVAYFTAWTMCQKIRYAMGERDEKYQLNGIVEMDEAFFGAPTEGGKRGRGTEKTPVLVALSLDETGKPQFLKMDILDAVNGEEVGKSTKKSVAKGSEIRTDGLSVYLQLVEKGYTLTQKNYDPKNQPEHLHWIHTIISNAKSMIDGTFHGLDKIHLQRYLNEYCYRFNRRHFKSGVFARLVNACASVDKITYHELIG
jgi:transposase-like protein